MNYFYSYQLNLTFYQSLHVLNHTLWLIILVQTILFGDEHGMRLNKDPRNDIDDFLESTNKGGKGK